jgi:hypothetical protein
MMRSYHRMSALVGVFRRVRDRASMDTLPPCVLPLLLATTTQASLIFVFLVVPSPSRPAKLPGSETKARQPSDGEPEEELPSNSRHVHSFRNCGLQPQESFDLLSLATEGNDRDRKQSHRSQVAEFLGGFRRIRHAGLIFVGLHGLSPAML